MIFFRSFLLLLVFLLSSLSENAYSQEDEVVLQLRWKHQFQFAGYYAAQKKGFYKEEGLNVNIKEYDEKYKVLDKMLSGEAQYGVLASDVMLDYMSGKKIKVLASIFQHSPYVIISTKERKVARATDMSGKRIMASEMGEIIVKSLLFNEGIAPDSVQIVPYDRNKFLSAPDVDAIVSYKTIVPYLFKRQKVDIITIEPSDYGVDLYGDILATTESETDNNPDRAERFTRASLKGWEYALQNPEEMIDYILSLPGVQQRGVDEELLKREYQVMLGLIRPNLVEIGHMNKGRWQFIMKQLSLIGVPSAHKNIDDLLYFPDQRKLKHAKWSIYIVSVLALFALFFMICNAVTRRRLAKEKEKSVQVGNKSRFNEESIKLILENAGIILWEWDVKTGKYELFGICDKENRSIQDFASMLHPDLLPKFELFLDLLPDSFSEEICLKIDGYYQWRQLTIKARKYDQDNRPMVFTGMAIDISEVKKKKERLDKLSAELEVSKSELEKFAYITSHNLRAPIVNIECLIDFYDFKAKDTDSNHDIVQKIKTSINRLKIALEELVNVTTSK